MRTAAQGVPAPGFYFLREREASDFPDTLTSPGLCLGSWPREEVCLLQTGPTSGQPWAQTGGGVGWTIKTPTLPTVHPLICAWGAGEAREQREAMRAFHTWKWALQSLLRGFCLPGMGSPFQQGRLGLGLLPPSFCGDSLLPTGCLGQRHPS